jgi:hypothetical protein
VPARANKVVLQVSFVLLGSAIKAAETLWKTFTYLCLVNHTVSS